MDLYSEQGFEETTVAEIAQRAGLTERTFFRHFADKREVLFSGSEALQEAMVNALGQSPASTPAIDAVGIALQAASERLQERRPFAAQRQAVIAANPELQERELIKLARLAVALADALRKKGAEEPEASLAAETGIAVFKVAFERWITDTTSESLPAQMRQTLERLKAVTSAHPKRSSRR
jgi:AcrR family transcriptional regulator